MKDEDIIKALECCSSPDRDLKCNNCPAHSDYRCMLKPSEVFDLVNRLQAEIERLTEENEEVHSNWQKLKKSYDELSDEAKTEIKRKDKILNSYALQYGTVKDQNKRIEEIKSEARKEFAESLKNATVPVVLGGKYHYDVITKEGIDNLLKELNGKENGSETHI